MADRDQIALDAATKIMRLVDGRMPVGGPVQLKAQVQTTVSDAISKASACTASNDAWHQLVADFVGTAAMNELRRRFDAGHAIGEIR